LLTPFARVLLAVFQVYNSKLSVVAIAQRDETQNGRDPVQIESTARLSGTRY
jgi:hypothetical protein